ncbi:GNAT family N-acetyltransferase [Priestia megaterium]|uniref:GNAT family N-acetyltransferase n=1 Tax=Priestia megaterium TaxID=1404 RepID=UPI0027DE84A6|nr:GNAT family N-acetyltransferase [Priestia megaterium]
MAEVDRKIAGSIAITKSSDKVAQLRWFVLDEKHQGMGLGKKLMETARKKVINIFFYGQEAL